ncbi:DUF4135 domain-containing protein [Streptomyces sp. SM14]|uniref:DUF4135 domain-containing protein n=1 Tax=Streptomyces sp. SM14 TaxID=1736045 RepID=UPI000CD573C9|nr:DUF4135 domain-containing protein [Streptomyces sp. SM14]
MNASDLPAGAGDLPGAEATDAPEASDAPEATDVAAATGFPGTPLPPFAALPPWTEPGPAGTVRLLAAPPGASPADPEAAATLRRTLDQPRYDPLHAMLRQLRQWAPAAAARHPGLLAAGLLSPDNAAYFGPLISEVTISCGLAEPATARRYAELRRTQWERFTETFLDRAARDLAAPPGADRTGPHGPDGTPVITGLRAHGEETHNGGRRVLCVTLGDGRRLAYKPRPADGERLLLDDRDSVFALLNSAPAASGSIRLPTLTVTPGSGADGDHYSWQQWIDDPPDRAALRTSPYGWTLTGPVLPPEEANRFWHEAGSLTAVCFGLGVGDLTGDNVIAGVRPGEDRLRLWAVDTEVCLNLPKRLAGTSLIHHPSLGGTHHCGLESSGHWCDLGGSPFAWAEAPGGKWQLERRERSATRDRTRTLVGDTEGRLGYGPYLPAMLRGMFDAWTLLCRNTGPLGEFLAERLPGSVVRHIPQDTDTYHLALLRHWGLPGREPDSAFEPAPDELLQFDRGDVPYFYRRLPDGYRPPAADAPPPPGPHHPGTDPAAGPLLRLAAAGETAERACELPLGTAPLAPVAATARGDWPTLSRLGVALRDAVEYAFDDLTAQLASPAAALAGPIEIDSPEHGVRICADSPQEGLVSFDWPRTGRRITYQWDGDTVRLRIDELTARPPRLEPTERGTLRRRLLRLDQVDTALRTPWAQGGFTDTVAAERLAKLTATGLEWLRSVVDRHGWPGRGLVGAEAAGAACRLLQHVEGETEFRRHCLKLVEEAVERGEMPPRDIAYLTDTLRLAEGRKQLYGTKFERRDGMLRPRPLEDPDGVEQRRAALRMESLEEYARLLRERFPDPRQAHRTGEGPHDAP